MNSLNYMKKINIQNYENLIHFFGNRVLQIFKGTNEINDFYYIEELNKDKYKKNDIIYGFPYINASTNTYLKDSTSSRVKTYIFDNNEFINQKTNRKNLSSELMYSENKEIAEDFDNMAKIIKSIKNIKKISEINEIVEKIENELNTLKEKHNIKEKYILGFDFEEENINLNSKIKDLFDKDFIFEFESNNNYSFLEVEIHDSYFNLLNKLESLGFDNIFYDFENERFNTKFLNKKCTFYISEYNDLEKQKELNLKINKEYDESLDKDFER